MSAPGHTCGVVVPVRNEAVLLSRTVPALLAALHGERARVIWICNGCTDDSASRIRNLAGSNAEILELPEAGKTAALQAGDDALGHLFPRVYLDADTCLRPGDVSRLLAPLREGQAELTTARKAFDLQDASSLAAAMARCWLALPYGRDQAFLAAIAISQVGRSRWRRWPTLSGDDIFVAATVPMHLQLLVPEAVAITQPPLDFASWVRVRARWLRGEKQLRALGFEPPTAPGQRRALLRRLVTPSTAFGAAAFASARFAAAITGLDVRSVGWLPNRARRRQPISCKPTQHF